MNHEALIDYRILGKNIKDARERLGKTQAAIANEMQIITSTYGKFERGVLKPSLERLVAICQILQISIESSLFGAVNVKLLSANTTPEQDRYHKEFQVLMNQCHNPKCIQAMLALCQHVVILENNK